MKALNKYLYLMNNFNFFCKFFKFLFEKNFKTVNKLNINFEKF